ncbi:hypothetical protein [Streptomyces sp. NPDC001978]|uniref:hypothetical protein n=1 Tax=Streptomyces sp. NPDC001978 TaxID=3364627 RepID=UPI0036801924
MRTLNSFIGRVGRRTALAAIGGIAVVAASVTVATAAVAGGGPNSPAPAATSTPAAPSPSSASNEGGANLAPDDSSMRGDDDMDENGWGQEDDGTEMSNRGSDRKGHTDDGSEMGEAGMGMGDG